MAENVPYETIPNGWYAVSTSRELRRGQLKSVRYFGRDLVLYRTESGAAVLADGYCPHLGAHFGDGCVRGENLRCPFHGFEFATDGKCVSTPYGHRAPAKAIVPTYPIKEANGFVLAYYDADGAAPTWEPPTLDGGGEWTEFRVHELRFRGHPQETSENSVDLGHFAEVHDYAGASVVNALVVEGPHLSSKYAVERRLDFIGLPDRRARLEFEAHVWGLGYSLVRAGVDQLGIHVRLLVFSTPVDASHVHMRIAASMRKTRIPLLDRVVMEFAFRGFVHDVSQDVPIWSKKRYVANPALAVGDGPIPVYRRYVKQFYPPKRVSLPVTDASADDLAAE